MEGKKELKRIIFINWKKIIRRKIKNRSICFEIFAIKNINTKLRVLKEWKKIKNVF